MTHEGLIKIIKTTYIRNKERVDNKRKIGEKDDTYFKKAEKLLYTEFSLALNMTYDETKDYVLSKVEENIKKEWLIISNHSFYILELLQHHPGDT